MSRFLFYSAIFLGLAITEFSFISSLVFPWQFIPLIPIVSIWLFHQKGSRIGLWFILIWGIWQDIFTLHSWSYVVVVSIVMLIVLQYFARRIFHHRSLYGLAGLGSVVMISWTAVEALFRFFAQAPLSIAFHRFLLERLFIYIFLIIGLSILFFFDLRFGSKKTH